MSYSDWIQSQKSDRVWLVDDMTALAQFAFITPIHRVRHWNPAARRRVKCWAREGDCVYCERNTPKIQEFTYGIYMPTSEYVGGGKVKVSYLSVPLVTHTLFQREFMKCIDNTTNPTDFVFEIKRTKLTTSFGSAVNGYKLTQTEMDVFVKEKFRPSLYNSEEQSVVWVVPEEIAVFLKERHGDPMNMIDLYLLLKDNFSSYEEKDLKTYAIKLCENNVLNVTKAQQKWI
mgnify:FL=1